MLCPCCIRIVFVAYFKMQHSFCGLSLSVAFRIPIKTAGRKRFSFDLIYYRLYSDYVVCSYGSVCCVLVVCRRPRELQSSADDDDGDASLIFMQYEAQR